MNIDPRLMERRKTVAEDNAKRNVGRLLRLLAVLIGVGGLVWLFFSPWLSVSQVSTTGISASNAHAVLADRGVVAGTPMIRISIAGTESALLTDPWVATATVTRDWPNRVTVDIVERVSVAWARTEAGWSRRALDGVALPSSDTPDETMAWIEMPELAEIAAPTTPDLIGALQFLDTLDSRFHPGTVVTRHEGELWATVAGYQVRLGRGVEMMEKALSLQAVLARDVPAGSTIVLIAPTNPAVMTPAAADRSADDGTAAADDATRSDDTVGNAEGSAEDD